jgi:hypothetical protein
MVYRCKSNQINVFSETKEKIFQINLEDQNGLDEDLSQVLAIRAEKIAEAKENFFKQVKKINFIIQLNSYCSVIVKSLLSNRL